MTQLTWFALNLPRDMQPGDVTAVLRPLASRPRFGLLQTTALVVFELWSVGGEISWRLGVDSRVAREVPAKMAAHLPRLGIVPERTSTPPQLKVMATVRMHGLLAQLRTEVADAVSAGLMSALQAAGAGEAGVVRWTVGPSRNHRQPPEPFDLAETLGLRDAQALDSTTARLWREKVGTEPLFACRGMVGANAPTAGRATTIARNLADALKLANTVHVGLQVGRPRNVRTTKPTDAIRSPLTWSCLLSAAELATVVGWPVGKMAGEELPLVGGHINAAPAALLVPQDDAKALRGRRILGESLHPAQHNELVSVPTDTCLRHMHLIGPTGSGKSNLLGGFITNDIDAGRSVLVLEPRGDLINDVLAHVPEHRRDDVVLIEPGVDRPVGMNFLAGPHDEAERRADQIVGLLHDLHGSNFGPRSADVALHAITTAARLPDGSLADVPALLTNPAFRRRVVGKVSDPLVLGPWWSSFDNLSEGERGQIVAPLLNKTRGFLSRAALRHLVGQPAPRFDLEELFTKRRIVLMNLNEGLLGREASGLLGALVLTQLWSAIQRRASVPAAKRHPVMVVIDEVQNYLHVPGVDLGDFFAQARGLGVSLSVAHQHLGQLSPAQRAAILANARSRVVFRPAAEDAKALAASFGSELTGDDLLRLRAFETCCQLVVDGHVTRPFSVRTRPLPPWRSDPAELRRISAERYGMDGAALDRDLLARWNGATNDPDGPVGVRRRRAS